MKRKKCKFSRREKKNKTYAARGRPTRTFRMELREAKGEFSVHEIARMLDEI